MNSEVDPVDVLAPWGPAGPPPAGQWSDDVLGPGFQAMTLNLLPDDEPPTVATLVHYLPAADPKFKGEAPTPRCQLLYLHGRNDYFFHDEFARKLAGMGVELYALDLRKYGRSLRQGQTIGYVTDLDDYDEEIGQALEIIGHELPLLLMGHSTGGLLAALWAYRHPEFLSGLVLNSAWLELQSLASMRPAAQQLVRRVAARHPKTTVFPSHGDLYGPSILEGWNGSGLDIPEYLDPEDPAVTGWPIATQWKRPESYPAPAAWLEAIMDAQEQVQKHMKIDCPVLSFASTGSGHAGVWSPDVFGTDVVLDAQVIVDRSAHLADCVTIVRLPGKHDLLLSDGPVREKLYWHLQQWLDAFVLSSPNVAGD